MDKMFDSSFRYGVSSFRHTDTSSRVGLTVVCETKWDETKWNETKWNETKWKSVVCEMEICSLRNGNL